MEVGNHLGVGRPALLVLLPEDVRGGPGIVGEEEQEVVFETVQRFGGDLERRGFHLLVGKKPETGDPAERGDVLVLLADRLPEGVDLDAARLLGQLLRVHQVLLQRVQGLEERGGEAAGRAEAGPGRHVGHAGDLEMGRLHPDQPEGLANQRVLHLVHGADPLQLRVLEDELLIEGLVQRDIHVLVDRGGEHKPAVLPIVGGQIGAPPTKGDPQRAPGDDHRPDAS